MALNAKCPKCGSERVQMSAESKNHGFLKLVFFGIFYILWLLIKCVIGLMILILYDWWMAIVHNSNGKGHVWLSRRWFVGKRRIYYCHDCGHNFKT